MEVPPMYLSERIQYIPVFKDESGSIGRWYRCNTPNEVKEFFANRKGLNDQWHKVEVTKTKVIDFTDLDNLV